MRPYFARQRFCCRACSDEWFQAERRQAVEWFRSMGLAVERKEQRMSWRPFDPISQSIEDRRADLAWQSAIKQLTNDAQMIEIILASEPPTNTAMNMWVRQWGDLHLVAAGEADPKRRARIEKLLAERAAAMRHLFEQKGMTNAGRRH
jgi:hypothetical protein